MSRAQTKPKHGRDSSSRRPAQSGSRTKGKAASQATGKRPSRSQQTTSRSKTSGTRGAAATRSSASRRNPEARNRDEGFRPRGARPARVAQPDDGRDQEAATREPQPRRTRTPPAKAGSRGGGPTQGHAQVQGEEPAHLSTRGPAPKGEEGEVRAEASRRLRSLGFDADDAGPRGGS